MTKTERLLLFFQATSATEVAKLRLDKLSKKFCVSRSLISQCFLKIYGQSHAYTRRSVIAKSIQSMLSNNVSHKNILLYLVMLDLSYNSGYKYIRMIKTKGIEEVLESGWK